MNIALDYDGTITADPLIWLAFLKIAASRGHDVRIVTMRYPSEIDSMLPQWQALIKSEMVPAIFTCRGAKRPFCEEAGFPVDIWIDDNPMAVEMDASELWPGTVAPEGQPIDPFQGLTNVDQVR